MDLLTFNTQVKERVENDRYLSINDLIENPDRTKRIWLVTGSPGLGKTTLVLSKEFNKYVNTKTGINVYIAPRKALVDSQRFKSSGFTKFLTAQTNLDTLEYYVSDEEVIIFDELDTAVKDTDYAQSVVETLLFLLRKTKCLIIAPTATPNILYFVDEIKDQIEVITKKYLLKYTADIIEVAKHGDVKQIINSMYREINSDNRLMVLCSSRNDCETLAGKFDNAFFIHSTDSTLLECGQCAKEYIISKEQFPPNRNILFATTAMLCGINILDSNVNTIICNTNYIEDVIQFFNRVRANIKRLIVIRDNKHKNDYVEVLQMIEQADNLEALYDSQEYQEKKICALIDYKGEIIPNPFIEQIAKYKEIHKYSDEEYWREELEPYSTYGDVFFLESLNEKELCNYSNVARIDKKWINKKLYQEEQNELLRELRVTCTFRNRMGGGLRKYLRAAGYDLKKYEGRNRNSYMITCV